MKNLISLFFSIIWLFILHDVQAQSWMQTPPGEKPNFYKIQKAFYDHWKDRPVEKGQGYNQFKRWEWYWEPRVYANGDFPPSSATWDAWHEYEKIQANPALISRSAPNWTFKGPSTTPGGYNGLGRINCIAFHPTNANTFWIGTPAGGLWKTTNGGTSWTTNTDKLPVLGVSGIAIDPSNPNTMYIATGDGNLGSLSGLTGGAEGDTKSIGVLKSTNGGTTWNMTGLNWNVTSAKLINRIIINPNNPQVLYVAASDGIWRTTNGGTSWSNVQSGYYFIDIEFKPNDPSVVYAATFNYNGNARIFRSTNSGTSWTAVAIMPGVIRINLAVTPAWPELVDAVCVNNQSGLAGLWYSDNSGANFTQYFFGSNSNNILHNSYNASGAGGQGHYDLAYAINPRNSNDTWIGGVNTWNSTDGGGLFYLKTMWNDHPSINPFGVPVVHADKHFIAFHPLLNNTMYECNDGGIYRTTDGGANWTDLSNGLQISQIYRIGVSQTISNNIICGLQDNGSREIYDNDWYEQTGGDGMECIIDYQDADTEYASYANGVIYRTYDFWKNQTTISDNIPGQPRGAWVIPFVIHPTNPNTLFAGYHRLYRTTNQGNSWTAISPVLTGDYLRSVAVAPSNPNTLYVATFDTLFSTTNGGASWFFVPAGIPGAKISYITVAPADSRRLYVTLSGYSQGNKVFMSPDAGNSWFNYSGSLPNVPVNCIVYQKNTNEGLYVGTDVGVFYTDASMNDWIPYQTGLPNVVVTELEISYNNKKLWAATFGRGLWNSDLFSGSVSTETYKTVRDVKLSPNPTRGEFSIQMSEPKLCHIEIYDVHGEKIHEKKSFDSTAEKIQLSNIKSGIYFVQISIDKTIFTRKLILNN